MPLGAARNIFNLAGGGAQEFSVSFLVLAGGGGGGGGPGEYGGGGGGAGGYRSSYNNETSGGGASAESALTCINDGTTYTVTVGAGGGIQWTR